MYVYSTLLTANGSLKTLNIIAFCGVLFNLSLNFYLIPHFKAEGGALTSFLTQTLLAITFIVFASRVAKLPFNARWTMAHIAYLGITIGLAYGVMIFMGQLNWLIQLSVYGAISIVLMFVLRFISISGLQQFLKQR